MEVLGTSPATIRGRVWLGTGAEPGGWHVDATDASAALQQSGSVGARAYLSSSTTNAPVVASVDDLRAHLLATSPSNTAPVVDSVTITPAAPDTNDVLAANVAAHDDEGDDVVVLYQWYGNGQLLDGATGPTYDLGAPFAGAKRDAFRVDVRVADAQLTSPVTASAPVVVQNTPPVVTAQLAPQDPAPSSTVTMSAQITDPDQEDHVRSYRWFLNGDELQAAVNQQSVDLTGVAQPGDVLRSELTVHEAGEPIESAVLVIDEVTYAAAPASLIDFDDLVVDATGRWRGGLPTPAGLFTHQGPIADYALTPNGPGMRLASAAADRSSVFTSVTALDTDLDFRFAVDKLPVGGNLFVYGIVRRVNAQTEYRAAVRIAPNGNVYLRGSAVVGNVETADRPRGAGSRPGGASARRAERPGAGVWQQPHGVAHPRLEGRRRACRLLALDGHEQRRSAPGRRRHRHAQLPRQRRHQRAGHDRLLTHARDRREHAVALQALRRAPRWPAAGRSPAGVPRPHAPARSRPHGPRCAGDWLRRAPRTPSFVMKRKTLARHP